LRERPLLYWYTSTLTNDTKSFYKALLALKLYWDEFLSKGTKITTPKKE